MLRLARLNLYLTMDGKMNKFIVIEGVDGAGKTMAARSVEREYNFKYHATPPEGYKSIRSYISEYASPMSRLLYYMAGNIDASIGIRRTLEETGVICDRYLFSTIISHSLRENIQWQETLKLIAPFESYLIMPAQTFLLDIEPDEQIKRINLRNKGNHSSSDKIIIKNEFLRIKFRQIYLEIAQELGWPIINTTNKKLEETVNEIANQI